MMHSSLTRQLNRSEKSVRPAFTLLELLVSIGVIGVLAAIVIVAVNPVRSLEDSMNSKRRVYIREQQNAAMTHIIKNSAMPATGIPEGKANAMPVCRATINDVSCINLDALVPERMSSLPVDPSQTGAVITGFRVYQSLGRVFFCSPFLFADDDQYCN